MKLRLKKIHGSIGVFNIIDKPKHININGNYVYQTCIITLNKFNLIKK